ncbi:MAG: YgdI/YgdR family lipoprotein [Defluviitaleaceae bacterium]|nr:YgdI/YgdR family lipoprotein [Defluviitaleaceae bacterium]
MKNIIALFLLIIMVFLLGGCGGDSILTGEWTHTDESSGTWLSFEFNEDGTVVERSGGNVFPTLRTEGTYITDEDQLILNMTHIINEETGLSAPFPGGFVWEFTFFFRENSLILIDINFDDTELVFARY